MKCKTRQPFGHYIIYRQTDTPALSLLVFVGQSRRRICKVLFHQTNWTIYYLFSIVYECIVYVSSCLNRYLLAPLVRCALMIAVIFLYLGPVLLYPRTRKICSCGSCTLE